MLRLLARLRWILVQLAWGTVALAVLVTVLHH
jgi:hypothetical protein